MILNKKEQGHDVGSAYERLIELKELHEKGIISREEYEQKKEKYLKSY